MALVCCIRWTLVANFIAYMLQSLDPRVMEEEEEEQEQSMVAIHWMESILATFLVEVTKQTTTTTIITQHLLASLNVLENWRPRPDYCPWSLDSPWNRSSKREALPVLSFPRRSLLVPSPPYKWCDDGQRPVETIDYRLINECNVKSNRPKRQ